MRSWRLWHCRDGSYPGVTAPQLRAGLPLVQADEPGLACHSARGKRTGGVERPHVAEELAGDCPQIFEVGVSGGERLFPLRLSAGWRDLGRE